MDLFVPCLDEYLSSIYCVAGARLGTEDSLVMMADGGISQ